MIERLELFARDRDVTLTDVAIGALLGRDVISSVIAGATKPEQVRSNAAAARWTPTAGDLSELEQALAPGSP